MVLSKRSLHQLEEDDWVQLHQKDPIAHIFTLLSDYQGEGMTLDETSSAWGKSTMAVSPPKSICGVILCNQGALLIGNGFLENWMVRFRFDTD